VPLELILKDVFAVFADGVAKEEELKAAGASKEEIEKEWLPGLIVSRACLCQQ